jgi:type IV pilus assembly protein PilC
MQFTYKATKNGEVYENTVDLPDRFSVYGYIKKEGGAVISVEEKSSSHGMKFSNNIFETISTSEKIIFTRNLSIMIKAGLALSRALSILERQSKNKKLKRTFKAVGMNVKKGSSFNEALSKFPKVFSQLLVSMVKAGEESGKLSESLSIVGKQMERAYQLKKKVKGALIYPAIIVIAMGVIGVVMLVYVVPTLTKTFDELGVDLPRSTQFVIALSDFLTNNTIAGVLIIIFFIGALILGFRSKKGKRMFDYVLLRIPVISNIVREVNSARTTRTLSSLLSSGVEVVNALSITKDVVQNSYYKEVLEQSQKDIQKGLPLSESFKKDEKIYPILVSEMIAVGEETGQLSEMLQQIAEFYESEVEQKTKNISIIIEPFLMVFIGIVVGFFAVSMVSPIYSISAGI